MEQANIALSLAALAFGVAACGGSDVRMRPDVPSDVTTTTGATAPASPTSATAPQPQNVEITQPSPSPDGVGVGTIDKNSTYVGGPTPRSTSAWDDATRKTRHAEAALTDPEIMAVIDSADRAERQLARETLRRTQNARVRQLAQRVLSDHGEAKMDRVERRASLVPADNETAAQLKSRGVQNVQAMQSATDRDFDQVAIDGIVAEERELLQLLDDKLIPQAQNPDLRTLLQEIRTSVSSRLGMATELQSPRAR